MRRHVMCLVTVLLLVPSTASAVTTSVTGVTAGGISRFIVDVSNPPMVHFTGTADVASVDLKCVSSQAGGGFSALTIADNVTVTSNAFATDAAWPSEGLCEVFAVNHGASVTSNTDLNGLSGMKVYPAYFDFSQTSGKTYDYYVQAEGSGAEVGFDSFGDCTMDYAQLVQLHEYDGQPFDCNGYVERIDQAAGGDTPSIRVDTHPAVPAYYIGSEGLGAVPGWSDVTFGVFDDAGSWRVEGHEGIYRCAGDDTFPPSSCAAFTSTGVRLDVTETLSPDARTIVQKLRFVSEDNQQHTLSTTLNQTSPLPREWFFPGTAGFQDYPLEANPSVTAPAVATIRNRDSGSADPDITKGFGAITYGSTPSEEEFWNAGRYFVQRYSNMTIPAGKAVRIEFIYNLAAGSSGLDSQVAAAESSIGAPPAISVTSPATATAAAYSLTGTVNAPETLNSVTVNDASVPVASDGSFSVPETLAAGANAFTVKATDELNRTTTTPFSVTLSTTTTPPPTNNPPAAVVFGKKGKVKLKGRTLTTALTASCPGAGPDCSITAVATSGRKKAGSGKATVKANATAGLKIKLSKAGVKLLKRKHKLSLKLSGKRTGASTTSATRTVTLKAKKKR